MEFRVDFTFRIVMDCVYYAVNLAFFKLLFINTSTLAGWSEPQVMIFVSGYLVIDAVQMTLFSNNLWMLPFHINKGDLDYYLVRPVSSLFFVSLRDFAVNSFINLFFAVGILAWSIHRYPKPLGFLKIGFYVLLLLNGTFLFYLAQMMFLIPMFWLQGREGVPSLFHGLSRCQERPDRIYKGWMRGILVTVLPFCLMTSFPARLLLEPFEPGVFFHLIGVTVMFFLGVVWLWDRGLRAYSSASS